MTSSSPVMRSASSRPRCSSRTSRLAARFGSTAAGGSVRNVDLDRLERVRDALGSGLEVRRRWRREGLDRLIDEAPATLVDRVVRELQTAGWETAVEVTFNDFGDRGSVDV